MNPYFAVLKRYADFNGRATRSEFWGFTLINAPILFVLTMIDIGMIYGHAVGFPYLTLFYYLAVFLPTLAVLVRRLHDTGRMGWWWFIILIPFIGSIVLIVFLANDSRPGPNRYGPDPKDEGNEPRTEIRPGLLLVGVMLLLVGVGLATSVYLRRFKDLSSSQLADREEHYTPVDLERIEAEAARMNTGLEAIVIQHSSGAASYGATVEVKNRSMKTFDWVMVEVEFYDKAGQVVSTLKTDARGGDPIPPDGMRSFAVRGVGKLDYDTVRASVVYSVEVK